MDETETVTQLQERLAASFEALRLAEERALVGQLALEVMHEIRNPLEALGHLAYLTTDQAEDSEQVRSYMKMAEEQIENASQIANQTLNFARASRAPKRVDLVTLAEAGLRIHQRTIEAKKIHLVRDFAEDVMVDAHVSEMLQVISNLITNALDALDEAGVLRVRLRRRQCEVRLVIADNGHGIRPEHSDAIFRPFFTTKAESGNGLGLTLSKRIVEHHQGTICMRSSVRPGKTGTIFKVSLPA
jgi:signal transduction histidine kinase